MKNAAEGIRVLIPAGNGRLCKYNDAVRGNWARIMVVTRSGAHR
jgi:hypothetical protein